MQCPQRMCLQNTVQGTLSAYVSVQIQGVKRWGSYKENKGGRQSLVSGEIGSTFSSGGYVLWNYVSSLTQYSASMAKRRWSTKTFWSYLSFFSIGYFLQKLSAYHYLVYYKSIYFFFRAILWVPEIRGKDTALNFFFYNFQMFNTQKSCLVPPYLLLIWDKRKSHQMTLVLLLKK